MEFGWIGVIIAVIATTYVLTKYFHEEKIKSIEEEKNREKAELACKASEEKEQLQQEFIVKEISLLLNIPLEKAVQHKTILDENGLTYTFETATTKTEKKQILSQSRKDWEYYQKTLLPIIQKLHLKLTAKDIHFERHYFHDDAFADIGTEEKLCLLSEYINSDCFSFSSNDKTLLDALASAFEDPYDKFSPARSPRLDLTDEELVLITTRFAYSLHFSSTFEEATNYLPKGCPLKCEPYALRYIFLALLFCEQKEHLSQTASHTPQVANFRHFFSFFYDIFFKAMQYDVCEHNKIVEAKFASYLVFCEKE